MTPSSRLRLLAGLVLVCLSTPALGQSTDTARQRLMTAKTLRCTLGLGSFAEWKSGRPVVEVKTWGKSNVIHFDAIDTESGRARMIGNAGAEDIFLLVTPKGLSFMEITAAGNMNFTTVFAEMTGNDFLFVDSRHVSVFGAIPSQYHGTCRKLD